MTLLHAASREALARTEKKLLGIAEAGAESELRTLGEQLFAVVGLLSGEIPLRRVLADASADSSRRERLLRKLVEGKVSARALDVLVSAVSQRWSSPRELVDGLESLARTALLVAVEQVGRLDTVEDELFRFGRIVAGDGELERLLSDPVAPIDGKLRLVRELVGGKVDEITVILVEQLVSFPRGRRAVAGLEELADLAAKRRQRSVAQVTTAVPLTEQQQNQLSATLDRIYARPIALHLEVDPTIMGGLVIRVGDEVIDGSAAGRLDALRRRLAG